MYQKYMSTFIYYIISVYADVETELTARWYSNRSATHSQVQPPSFFFSNQILSRISSCLVFQYLELWGVLKIGIDRTNWHTWYLSLFLHGQNFWRIKFTPKKCVNYDKIHSKLPIFCVITAKYTVNFQFFALNL